MSNEDEDFNKQYAATPAWVKWFVALLAIAVILFGTYVIFS